jgi:hypothetical protein
MHRSVASSAPGLRRSLTEAVQAASSQDADRFTEAADRLALQDPQRLSVVQAWMLRCLLEELHPEGLSSEDAQDVLRHCLLSTSQWYGDADPGVLVRVLTGALGLSEPEQAATAGSTELSSGAALLIADLLSVAGGSLAGYLDAALAELERAETIELP